MSLSAPSGEKVTVKYRTPAPRSDTATRGEDYTAASGDLVFAPGETEKSFAVLVNGDTVNEAAEAFTVNLHAAVGAKIASDTAQGVILNDDGVNRLPVASAGADQVVDENTPVTLDGSASTDPDGDALGYAWTQTGGPELALTGADTATPGFTAPSVDADVSLTFRLTVTDSNGASASDEVTVTVLDQRVLSIADIGVDEGSDGETVVELAVVVTPAAGKDITVDYATADGTAKSPRDYAAAGGTLTIPAGSEGGVIRVVIAGDTFEENDESFTLELLNPQVAALGRGLATITVLNDDDKGLLRVGAAKRPITPTQAHIDGIVEPRLDGTTRLQRFNLGGFGVNPTQNLPDDPFGGMQTFGEALTEPASQRVFTGSRGPEDTHVRVMVLEQKDGTRVAFVMIDAVGAGNLIQKGLKEAVNEAACGLGACFAPAGTPGEQIGNVVFGQTHTHAGADLQGLWGGVPQDWVHNVLYTQAAAAAAEALQGLQPSNLTFRQGYTVDFNNYRRPRYDVNADADGTLTLVQATADEGAPVGSILQYNAHPTSINEDPRLPHADYIQGAMDWLEAAQTGPGGVALYYNGPIADASGSGGRAGCAPIPSDQDYGNVRCRGEGIADKALRFAPQALAPTIETRHVEVTLPVTNPLFLVAGGAGTFNRYYDFLALPVEQIPGFGPLVKAEMINLPQLAPVARTLVSRITLGGSGGGLEIVTIPGEATNTFGQYIRGLTANRNMMLLGLTQNSFGYILPEEEFNYVDESGDAGFVAPFSGYEEHVSLGPLTAPLLRIEGYNRLFDQPPEQDVPPVIAACLDSLQADHCVLNHLAAHVDYTQRSYADGCREFGVPAEICALSDPQTPLYESCIAAGFADATCRALGAPGGADAGNPDLQLAPAAVDALARGCDLLDTSHCLLPFPSDHFTVAAAPGSPQSVERGGTGRRVNLNALAMPRNVAGKPIDPSEWNRNDGFSPGQMIVTYVPNLAVNPDGTIPGAPPLTDIGRSLDVAASSVVVLDAETGRPHPVWAEIDSNAGLLVFEPTSGTRLDNPKPKQAALIIRPAVNFEEGRRYVVALKDLRDASGAIIPAQPAFRVCRDALGSSLPPVADRCAKLATSVFPVLDDVVPVKGNAALYLAWDFTVASAENNVGRLRHMRDDAFVNYLGQVEEPDGDIVNLGRAPAFAVSQVEDNPNAQWARIVRGTITVPSYVVPADPSPLDTNAQLRQLLDQLPPELRSQLDDGVQFAANVSLPNRLNYNPLDGLNPDDPLGSRYGDGLPDRAGEMTAKFRCNIPKVALSGKDFASASPADVVPARVSIYGHGLLGSLEEVGSGAQRAMNAEHNFVYCAVDWFGFAGGDIPNVVTTTLDMSNFPVIPDASQQGMLNQLFLARLLRHPQGFAADPAFQVGGVPVLDTREVFYDGNSQGGILGGPVIALSKDIQRGVLGVVGMNYSTLLTRSVDFDIFSVPIYLSYPDDLDRDLLFSLIQMLWDRSENNGYAHHLTDNTALHGPDNRVLLHAAFADHQVTHWSAQVMARTIGVDVADMYQRRPGEGEPFTYATKWDFFAQRDPDVAEFWALPLAGRDTGADYDAAPCAGASCETARSAFVEFDQGRTAIPPIGNVPPRADDHDPHGFPRGTVFGRCQKSHFMHSQGRIIDVRGARSVATVADCPALPDAVTPPRVGAGGKEGIPPFPLNPCAPDFVPEIGGECLLDVPVVGDLLNTAWGLLNGEEPPGPGDVQPVVDELQENLATLPADLATSVQQTLGNAAGGTLAARDAEVVIMEGRQFPDWSQPAAVGVANPYPSGVGGDGEFITGNTPFYVRDAHNGQMLYPPPGVPFQGLPTAAPVAEIVAYKRANDAWIEIPVQVDERFPYFLANANSGFSFYSGTDLELTYAWDREPWKAGGECYVDEATVAPTPDPVPGLDDDDEIAFMARDAGEQALATQPAPAGTVGGGQEIALVDPLNPQVPKFVYLFRKPAGPTFSDYYVDYRRDANAGQWIDRSFFQGAGPEADPYRRADVGTSNRGYGPNVPGVVCWDGVTPRTSSDRFPRDGVTVSTDNYQLYASGRWMVRDVRIAKPDQPRVYGPDVVDRWKGRAFQQSPDSTISLVGFEDEQVNWEANSALLGERVGPVRAIREIWGADSGTNVTKTETYYRDAYTFRYRVRVHPIPPDGLYTSWDYNRGAMVPAAGEDVPGGRYYTAIRGTGAPIDGLNDDIGNVDGVGDTPAYFDMADPTLNLPLAMYNWEQVSAKGDLGSLVYMFELKSPTIGANAVAVPYYRDDACLDDGTGDDPVARPFPGESYRWEGGRVPQAYDALAGRPLDHSGATFADCVQRQGAHGSHGVHFLLPPESDNAFLPVPVNEIDGQQWAFAVPTGEPTNVGERYANVVRVPLVRVVTPRPAAGGGGQAGAADERGVTQVAGDFIAAVTGAIAEALAGNLVAALDALLEGANLLVAGFEDLLIGNEHASVLAVAEDIVYSPGDAGDDVSEGTGNVLEGFFLPEGRGRVFAGVGVVDMTPDVGYGAGQYSAKSPDTPFGEMDPYATHKTQKKSYGVQSRLTARAIVVEGSNGKRIALLKSDNYLAQDILMRRVAQILEENGSSIGYDQILYGVTHAHSSSYYSTPSWGVWLFQDVFEPRFFEDQARKLAQAILTAERDMKPARMGATTVRHKIFKGQIVGPTSADDGTPAGYPREYGDLGLVVMRFETDEAQPIAVWVNWGEHPEGLDGYDLHSPDFVGVLERFVERDLGAPLVFSQGDVGSAEKSGNTGQRVRDDGTVCNDEAGETCEPGQGVWRDWNHGGYVQNERNVRFLADAVVKGWKVIGGELAPDPVVDKEETGGVLPNNYVPEVQVPLSGSFPVDYRNAFVPGPLSHPYPSLSNCRTEPTAEGNPGAPILGLPDCERAQGSNDRAQIIWETLKEHGIPLPEHYDAPAFIAVEENLRLKLQAFRLGDVVLGSCACEAQVDLILNFESRANDAEGDIYDGFDWACVAEDRGQLPADPAHAAACGLQRDKYYDVREFPTGVPGNNFTAPAMARMRAQVHNPADGWDAPEYVPYANAEPADPKAIKGNFTKEELPAARGFKLAVGIGHAGDYNGYTVSYREYMRGDHYRKALTAYGAHTADYMVTRLVRMAGAMKGAPELKPEPHDVTAQADEVRQVAVSHALGVATQADYEAFLAALPPDVGPACTTGDPGCPVAGGQPKDIGYFNAATFTWRGGSTAVDNPQAWVERCINGSGDACAEWQRFADQTGEVQTRVQWPVGVPGVVQTYTGQQQWLWTANFEAYEAFPARLGDTPAGTYRFVVQGCINDGSNLEENIANRIANLLAGILPRSLGDPLGVPACRGGASPYALASAAFEVVAATDAISNVQADANGDLSFQVVATSIPRSYASFFPYINTGDDFGKFCKECTFRPWATPSSAGISAVTVEVAGQVIDATGSETNWSADANLAEGQSATINVTYSDGRAARPVTFTRSGSS